MTDPSPAKFCEQETVNRLTASPTQFRFENPVCGFLSHFVARVKMQLWRHVAALVEFVQPQTRIVVKVLSFELLLRWRTIYISDCIFHFWDQLNTSK